MTSGTKKKVSMKWFKTISFFLVISQFSVIGQITVVPDDYLLPANRPALLNSKTFPDFKLQDLSMQFSVPVNTPGMEPFIRDPDFWLSIAVNLAGTGLFLSRVHHPPSAEWFGIGTEALGIPALVLGISDLVADRADFITYANLGYAAWAVYAVTVDHILDINYRDPFKPAIIVPYVVSYYLAIGSMSAGQFENGWVPWIICGTACLINVGASFYARSKGAD